MLQKTPNRREALQKAGGTHKPGFPFPVPDQRRARKFAALRLATGGPDGLEGDAKSTGRETLLRVKAVVVDPISGWANSPPILEPILVEIWDVQSGSRAFDPWPFLCVRLFHGLVDCLTDSFGKEGAV